MCVKEYVPTSPGIIFRFSSSRRRRAIRCWILRIVRGILLRFRQGRTRRRPAPRCWTWLRRGRGRRPPTLGAESPHHHRRRRRLHASPAPSSPAWFQRPGTSRGDIEIVCIFDLENVFPLSYFAACVFVPLDINSGESFLSIHVVAAAVAIPAALDATVATVAAAAAPHQVCAVVVAPGLLVHVLRAGVGQGVVELLEVPQVLGAVALSRLRRRVRPPGQGAAVAGLETRLFSGVKNEHTLFLHKKIRTSMQSSNSPCLESSPLAPLPVITCYGRVRSPSSPASQCFKAKPSSKPGPLRGGTAAPPSPWPCAGWQSPCTPGAETLPPWAWAVQKLPRE